MVQDGPTMNLPLTLPLSVGPFPLLQATLLSPALSHHCQHPLSYFSPQQRFRLNQRSQHRMSPPDYWKQALLETDHGQQQAQLFAHPNRDPGFPNIYRLPGPHPLRPLGFTANNYSRCGRSQFVDYVVTIRKDFRFMKNWDAIGKETETPTSDVSSNLENGMHPLGQLISLIQHPFRLASTERGRHALGEGRGRNKEP